MANVSRVPWRKSMGSGDAVEVFVAQFFRLAGRVQRVAEVHQPGGRHAFGHCHGRHPSAEGLAGRPEGLALGPVQRPCP